MKKLLTIDVAVVRMHFNILERNGVPQKILEDTLGFSREDIQNDDIQIPFKKNFQMLKKGLELTEPTMTMKIGKMYSLQKVGIIGQLIKNCRDLEEASYQFLRYQNFYYGSSIFELISDDSYRVLKHSIVQTVYCTEDFEKRLLTELNLSSCVALIRQLTNENFNPKEMALDYLANKRLSTAEIAFLLGYSEVSAFQRAFKNWTGKNPTKTAL